MSAQNVGVSIRSRNGAPPRKGGVVNGQMTKASNKGLRPPAIGTEGPSLFPSNSLCSRLLTDPRLR